MLNDLKKPCAACPFKEDSLRGWLGGETVQSTLDFVNREVDFACHKTRHKKEENMSRCKGYLLFMKKQCKLPKYNKDLEKCVREIDYNEAQESNILSVPNFIKHHTL